MLAKVLETLETLAHIGERYDGLFPSIIDRRQSTMLRELPPAIPGQRDGDRSHLGSNLIHDEATLLTMFALAQTEDRPGLAAAADAYLETFAQRCTRTLTGLYPWGEHSFWHLEEGRIGNSYRVRDPGRPAQTTHDHLRAAPIWLWEKLHAFRPECVESFADGLEGHWTEGAPPEYIRHALIEEKRPHPRGDRSCDFPRHGGFYILDWAFAYAAGGRPERLAQTEKMADYWWPLRDDAGLLLIESRSPADDSRFFQVNAPGQTLSLAVSFLEAAERLPSELAATMQERASVYIDGFLAAPHDLEGEKYVLASRRDGGDPVTLMPVWGSRYGVWPAAYVALTCLCGFRLTDDERLLGWAIAVGRSLLRTPFPIADTVPAMDAGLGIGLLADLYDLTGSDEWLSGGLEVCQRIGELYFDDLPLPRGASGIDWYESQMGPGFLLHGIARMSLLVRDGRPCPLTADYTAR
ncbi:MAG: hypothetical protein CL878_10190 [Dehalococcoidia bacterium]|nr:hypothetical protein [Dehalococcoidia bacterium]